MEKRQELSPSEAIRGKSSRERREEWQAMSPVSPPRTLPGVWLKVSHINGPFPTMSAAPSIWYAAVDAPQMSPGGKSRGRQHLLPFPSSGPPFWWRGALDGPCAEG